MTDLTLTPVDADVLTEATDDAVGLWSVAWRHRERGDPASVRAVTEASLHRLLSSGLIEPGEFADDGQFEHWGTSAEETLRRVRELWDGLGGRPPDIGEGPWFVATKKGHRVAQSLAK